MECDKLLKNTLGKIEFTYKIDDALKKIESKLQKKSPDEDLRVMNFTNDTAHLWDKPEYDHNPRIYAESHGDYATKLAALFESDKPSVKGKSLYKMLINEGVSTKEMKFHGLDKYLNTNDKIQLSQMYQEKLYRSALAKEKTEYYDSTYKQYGVNNESYSENMFVSLADSSDKVKNVPHFSQAVDDTTNLVGWNRTSINDFNGEETLYLHELQSDWMQTERAKRGIFESNVPKNALPYVEGRRMLDDIRTKARIISRIKELVKDYRNGYVDKDTALTKLTEWYPNNMNEANNIIKQMSEDVDQYLSILRNLLNELREETTSIESRLIPSQSIVPDFPMKPEKFQQLMIVDAIDQAMKNNLKKIVIPIDREKNNLFGTAGVTKFYEQLNKGILPAIRSKLYKQGLKLKVTKETVKNANKPIETTGDITDDMAYEIYTTMGDQPGWQQVEEVINGAAFMPEDTRIESLYSHLKDTLNDANFSNDIIEARLNDIKKIIEKNSGRFTYKDNFHVIEIEQVPNKPIRWDIFSVIGALGLTDVYNKLEDTTNDTQ